MKKIVITLALSIAFASISEAGVLRATYKHGVKPAAKTSYKVGRAIVKAIF